MPVDSLPPAKAPKAPRRPKNCDGIGLIPQGGGALGAYQAGVYQAMHEAGLEPDWVAGVSIGGVNGAIIAGNKPDDRLDCLRAIHLQTHILYDILQNRVRVQVITAEPLSPELEAKLRISLRAMLGGEPLMETVVDPTLIGGAVLKIGDTVYDGSIANQLNTLRQEMMDWSAHEIQSRRDRFVNPTRN